MIINKLIFFFGFITSFFNYKGFYKINLIITHFINKKKIKKIKLNSDTYFNFLLKDPYYNRLIYPKFEYEPEIEFILRKFKKINYLFVDVGANLGYWSLIASSKQFNKKKSIAIEPLKSNYNFLKKNQSDNKRRFQILNIGIGEKNKYSKIFYSGSFSNAGASINKDNGSNLINSEIIKIDTIDNILSNKRDKKIIIKLDIEGNEVNAIKGALETINKSKPLIIIEFSKYIFENMDNIYYLKEFLIKYDYSIYDTNYKKKNIEDILSMLKNLKKRYKTIGNFYLIKNNSNNLKIFLSNE